MPCCTQEDAEKMFGLLQNYTVEYEGRVLETALEMNAAYWDFDNWTIVEKDGRPVRKRNRNVIRKGLEEAKNDAIENGWCRLENRWNSQVKAVENWLFESSGEDNIDADYILEFVVMLNWRGSRSNEYLEIALNGARNGIKSVLESIAAEHPEDDSLDEVDLTAEMQDLEHNVLLNKYQQYFKDDGLMFSHVKQLQANFMPVFAVANGSKRFCTSDRPSFEVFWDNKPIYLLPMTPRILIACVQKTDAAVWHKRFDLTNGEVERFNAILRKRAQKFILD